MNKKLFALILAGLMLMPAFMSCSEKPSENNNETTPPSNNQNETVDSQETEEEKTTVSDDLPEKNFNGSSYMIYNTNPESNDWYTTTFVTFEEDSAEAVPSAIFNRNLLVEDRFGVKIEESYQDNNQVKQGIISGGGDFEIALLAGSGAISLAQEGYLYDLKLLKNLNFEKPYWDRNAADQLTIANKLYVGVGDFMTTHIDETIVTFFNKSLIEDYGLESPYGIINDMKWTYDKMGELGKVACIDVNGDGKRDDNDNYALMSWSGVLYPYLLYGSGEKYVNKNEDDMPELSFYGDRFLATYEKVLNICHSDGDTFTYDAQLKTNTKGLTNNHRVQEIMFPNNQVLFWVECVSWSKALRDMDTDFGIIPAPMLDEEQGQYYNYVNGNFYAPAIPTSVKDTDYTTTILEALNSMSTNTVLNAYYEITLKTKYSRDEESSAMLDIIFNNRNYDVSVVYGIANISADIYSKAAKNDTDIASYYNKNRKAMNKLINKVYEKVIGYEY